MNMLIASLLVAWAYGDFTADLPQAHRPKPSPAPAVIVPPCQGSRCDGVCRPPVRPTPQAPAKILPAPAMPPPAPAPVLYRLADATGKVWEHEDPAWLRTWVGRVNASMAAQQQPAFQFQYRYQQPLTYPSQPQFQVQGGTFGGGGCAGGSCGRR